MYGLTTYNDVTSQHEVQELYISASIFYPETFIFEAYKVELGIKQGSSIRILHTFSNLMFIM